MRYIRYRGGRASSSIAEHLSFLTIKSNEEGWSHLDLDMGDETRPLGAEKLKYLANHLVAFFNDETPGLRWIFSLSELHTSAYGETIDRGLTLHLHDTDERMFAQFEMSKNEKQESSAVRPSLSALVVPGLRINWEICGGLL